MIDMKKIDKRVVHIVDSCDTIHEHLNDLSEEITSAEKLNKRLERTDKIMVIGAIIIAILMAIHIFG
jgi:hypothetical protein